ncbi:MAG: PQQ-binding-like beta-propeller repeat protein [Mycobacteriales bacterium]|nr:PQQ-binding-like beta-propeller repeat protein [Mycobacteriales bacterium]
MINRPAAGSTVLRLCIAVGLIAAGAAALPAAAATGACAPAEHSGGEWATFGADLSNTRTQPAETTIGIAEVPLLTPVWSFSTGGASLGFGDLNGTPIVSSGCVYLNTAAGDVIALNADTGELVWQHHEEVPLAGLGGDFVSSPVAADGLLVALVNRDSGPYAIAFDQVTGAVAWRSRPVETSPGYYTNATPVVHDGILVFGFSAPEGNPASRGGYALLDLRTGRILDRSYVVPDADFAAGYAGGGVWTAPAIDEEQGFAYMGTANPYSKKIEHPNTNAIIKVDLNRGPTFGDIVGSYKGNIDQLSPAFRDLIDPVCDAVGEEPALQLVVGNSAPCLQLDLDFGAPPNLFRDSSGRLLIGDLQKSGIYHVADADSMAPAWQAAFGASCPACNAAATAFDGSSILGVGTPGGVMLSRGRDDGALGWASPVADGVHYQSTTVANGVAYTVDGNGFVDAFDASTGLPLLRRPVLADSGQPAVAVTSSGVAVARNTVYVAAGNALVAYQR